MYQNLMELRAKLVRVDSRWPKTFCKDRWKRECGYEYDEIPPESL